MASPSDSRAHSRISSFDDDEVNFRLSPDWTKYRSILESCGVRLDTNRDVKNFYHDYAQRFCLEPSELREQMPGYSRACRGRDENALCKDAGLPDNLFRGTYDLNGAKIVVKAVHLYSRELEVVRYLSSPAMRRDPKNHCIPVLAFIEVPIDNFAFIVMEEWYPNWITNGSRTLREYFDVLRQCIQHCIFMHAQHIAHLDISANNILTNHRGRYAFIDFEMSRRFDGMRRPRVGMHRCTEIPPELDRGEASDPYKMDIWALGMLFLRASELTGRIIPGLASLIESMLRDRHEQRPTAVDVGYAFDRVLQSIPSSYLDIPLGDHLLET